MNKSQQDKHMVDCNRLISGGDCQLVKGKGPLNEVKAHNTASSFVFLPEISGETSITACAKLGQAQQSSIIQTSNHEKSNLLASAKLTIKEAAKVLKIGETSLRRLIYKGEIQVVRIGTKILMLESDIEVFLQEHYGTLKTTSLRGQDRLPALPHNVIESKHIKGRK